MTVEEARIDRDRPLDGLERLGIAAGVEQELPVEGMQER